MFRSRTNGSLGSASVSFPNWAVRAGGGHGRPPPRAACEHGGGRMADRTRAGSGRRALTERRERTLATAESASDWFWYSSPNLLYPFGLSCETCIERGQASIARSVSPLFSSAAPRSARSSWPAPLYDARSRGGNGTRPLGELTPDPTPICHVLQRRRPAGHRSVASPEPRLATYSMSTGYIDTNL